MKNSFNIKREFTVLDSDGKPVLVNGYQQANQTAYENLKCHDNATIIIRLTKEPVKEL